MALSVLPAERFSLAASSGTVRDHLTCRSELWGPPALLLNLSISAVWGRGFYCM